jgi:hypothetical protein
LGAAADRRGVLPSGTHVSVPSPDGDGRVRALYVRSANGAQAVVRYLQGAGAGELGEVPLAELKFRSPRPGEHLRSDRVA